MDLGVGAESALQQASRSVKKKATRAERRRQVADMPPLEFPLAAAELKAVSAVTRDLYIVAHSKFMQWARKLKMRLPFDVEAKRLDTALVKYLDEVLFLAGEGAGQARNTLFGTMFCRSLPRHASTLPRARRALKGFVRDEPSTSKDPIPLEAVILIVRDLLTQDALLDKLAAFALVMSFDLFTRPSETLRIEARDVVAPTAKRYKVVSVMIAQTETYDDLAYHADDTTAFQAKIGQPATSG